MTVIAIQGCCHGELPRIYATLEAAQQESGVKVDLLLVCGDFQAIRNEADLRCLAVPEKYRQLGTFHEYYSGKRVAPLLTIIIGGNHEASNYMWELHHGGWVAPSIYYLGTAGSVLVNGLRISGASGIFNARHFQTGHFEKMPYNDSTMRSIYHIRQYEVFKLAQMRNHPIDIFLSHDWPLGIVQHGDTQFLLKIKPFFREEIKRNQLGSPPLMELLKLLKPEYWFAAHLHVKFAALYKHDGSPTTVIQSQAHFRPRQKEEPETNPDEIQLDDEEDPSVEAQDALKQADSYVDESMDLEAAKKAALASLLGDDRPVVEAKVGNGHTANPDEINLEEDDKVERVDDLPGNVTKEERVTKFLALSKCTPRLEYLQIMDIASPLDDSHPTLTFDPLWLAITRAFQPHLSLEEASIPLPQDLSVIKGMVDKELKWVQENLEKGGKIDVNSVQKFVRTAPAPEDGLEVSASRA